MELRGTGASEGGVTGKALVFRHERDCAAGAARENAAPSFEAAMEQFYRGRRLLCDELRAMAAEAEQKYNGNEAGIFEGYAEILMDDEIEELAASFIREGASAAEAARQALEQQARELEALDNEYMRQRGADLADIGRRLAAAVAGEQSPAPVLAGPCILVADELSPFEMTGLDHRLILGIAMDRGGVTGHAAILARSLGIPCVVGLEKASALIETGADCALDGARGLFVIAPDAETAGQFRQREAERKRDLALLEKSAAEPACTADGFEIPVCANIGSPAEAARAAERGADGVGLFRTEFLYMADTRSLPTEDEQFEAYRAALRALGNKPLTIRTLDMGGDKEHPALGLAKEDNPFLGYRAIRLALDRPRIFKPQLRAVLRAAALGRVQLMFPLVVSPDEFRRARSLTAECLAELEAEGTAAALPPLGIMVETPAAALLARAFAAEVDFFSIGTNDLAQYTLAADRGNPRLAGLYDPLNPAVLRLVALTCEAAAEQGIPVSICGELAGDRRALPLLAGLGIGKLSVSASLIPAVKAGIRALNRERCRELARRALALSTAAEVYALLDNEGNKE